jgi:hypothetical protein
MAPNDVRYIVARRIPERATWRYTGTLVDEAGDPIAAAQLTTLTLTIHVDNAAKTSVLAATNIKNTDRGTVHDTDGTLSVLFDPDDSEIKTSGVVTETHIATLQWAWAAGARESAREIAWVCQDMAKRPTPVP